MGIFAGGTGATASTIVALALLTTLFDDVSVESLLPLLFILAIVGFGERLT